MAFFRSRRKIFPFQIVSSSIRWKIFRGSVANYLTLVDDWASSLRVWLEMDSASPGPCTMGDISWFWDSQALPSMSGTGKWFDNMRMVPFMGPVQGGDIFYLPLWLWPMWEMSWFGCFIASPGVAFGYRVKNFYKELINHIDNLLSATELNYG